MWLIFFSRKKFIQSLSNKLDKGSGHRYSSIQLATVYTDTIKLYNCWEQKNTININIRNKKRMECYWRQELGRTQGMNNMSNCNRL